MHPPVFTLLNTPVICGYVGSNPVRIFDFGIAPPDVARPYIVFNQVAGNPFTNVSDAPCADVDLMQIDLYSDDRAQIRALSKEVQSVLDAAGVFNRLTMQVYEPETGLFRIGLDADFVTFRSP